MTDALLVSDQQIDAGLLHGARSNRGGFSWQNLSQDILLVPGASSFSGNNSFYGEQVLQGYGCMVPSKGVLPSSFASRPFSRATVLDIHLWRAKAAPEEPGTSGERSATGTHFQEELRWLAENKHKFIGAWIALQGMQLLAVGATAKEVFAKVAGLKSPPLVVKISDEDVPFAGW